MRREGGEARGKRRGKGEGRGERGEGRGREGNVPLRKNIQNKSLRVREKAI